MIEATYMGTPKVAQAQQVVDPYPLVSTTLQRRIDDIVYKMRYIGVNDRKYHIIRAYKWFETYEEKYALTAMQQQAMDYIKSSLAEIYPR